MVSLRRGRRGTSGLGCLVMLVVFGAAVYYGLHIGAIYMRYYELLDDMQQQARLGSVFPDDSIQRHLGFQADSLLGQPLHFQIHRAPSRMTISTEYSEELNLPLLKRTFVLKPYASEPF